MDDDSQVQDNAPVTETVPVPEPASAEENVPPDASTTESVTPQVPVSSEVSAPVPASATPTPASTFDPHSADEMNFLRFVLSPKAWAARRALTAARLEKVMQLVQSKGTIDRTSVRLHLEVSQAAATRYLTALVKQGKLVRRHTQGDTLYTAA